MDIKKYPGIEKIALLVTCAAVLQVAESFLPRLPIPGVRLGLANLVTIIAMAELGFGAAMEVAVLRCVIGSLMLGTFLSPAFILSLGASVTSTLVMSAVFFPLKKMKNSPVSVAGVSVFGAVAHNAAQLFIVYALMINNKSVLLLLPWLGISGVVTGFVTGVIAAGVCRRLEGSKARADIMFEAPTAEVPYNIQARPEYLVALAAVFTICVMFLSNPVFLSAAAAALIILAVFSGAGIKKSFFGIKRAWLFILFAAMAPALYNGHGNIIFEYGFIIITQGGFNDGFLFAARLILLMASAGLLSATAGPKNIASGLEKLAKPLEFLGIEPGRLSVIMALAWINFEGFWKKAAKITKEESKNIRPGIGGIFISAENVVVRLYTGSAAGSRI